jgi:hypothetical protein
MAVLRRNLVIQEITANKNQQKCPFPTKKGVADITFNFS